MIGKEGHRKQRSQAALQYLMTYGWAILIIAIVLVVLYHEGVFSSGFVGVRAQPGSCQVLRNGQGSVPTLSGICSGELPEYVAQLNGAANVLTPLHISSMPAITVTAWFNLNNVNSGANPRIVANGNTVAAGDYHGIELVVNNGGGSGLFAVGNGITDGSAAWTRAIGSGTWYFYVGTYSQSSGTVTAYINGNAVGTASFNGLVNGVLPVAIGYDPASSGTSVAGYISNVQIYNTSLSANEVKTLYYEGIGGAPAPATNLVAWWQLNGNANDNGGGGYNAKSSNVVYTAQWSSSYIAP